VFAHWVGPLIISGAQWHDLTLAAFDDSHQVLAPQLQRRSDLAIIARAIVNPGDATLVARDMIEQSFDDVRLYADFFSHMCCRAATKIVQGSIRQRLAFGHDYSSIEKVCRIRPCGETGGATIKNIIVALAP